MVTVSDVFFAAIAVGLLILLGSWIKQRLPILQKLYLPESIIAGTVGLLLGPDVFGRIIAAAGGEGYLAQNGLFPESMRTVWEQVPGILIILVFAALFLGEKIPNWQEIWRKTSPQVAFAQTLAWGQYVTGIGVTLLILTPFFQADPLAGILIEVAFEGGHGTAAGMAGTFAELGFFAASELGLALATVGIISAVVIGTILVNWGIHKGHTQVDSNLVEEVELLTEEKPIIKSKESNLLVDGLSFNFGFTALAIGLGWLILVSLQWLESYLDLGFRLFKFVPLFPLAMLGGLIVQLVMERFDLDYLIERHFQEHIGGIALDLVVVTALATINLRILGANFAVFLILSLVGIAWNVLAFVYLAPRLLPNYWFERGICDLGQSMGVTPTGLLLLRMVDPQNQSGAFESFAYKQLLFTPFVGGGIFTAAAPILISKFGSMWVLLITGSLLIFWLFFGLWNYQQLKTKS
ncbi:MAG: sodium/glutamate symporter [Oscillatoria sp. PMC 1068.18]|nr:sodium/glutamate symporter [Oscillatoria sp. PMC 1076.18]MEC4991423.1 sodium/glutamate symporter [Oscillatoria sp. PMC 1068.18]